MNVRHIITKTHHKIINDLYETNTVVNKIPNILLKGYVNKHIFKNVSKPSFPPNSVVKYKYYLTIYTLAEKYSRYFIRPPMLKPQTNPKWLIVLAASQFLSY
jgi:hypothetical protein